MTRDTMQPQGVDTVTTDGPTSMQQVYQQAAGGTLPDKSPFPSMTDEEYQQQVMKQFQTQLRKLMAEEIRKKNATKKKKLTGKQLKAKRKQSRRKGNK